MKLATETRKPIFDQDHQPLRVAVMKEDVGLIKEIVKNDKRLLRWGENLAMTIARYHGKQQSIKVLEELMRSDL